MSRRKSKMYVAAAGCLAVIALAAAGFCVRRGMGAPVITQVRVLDGELEPLTAAEGWIQLDGRNFVEVEIKGKFTRVEYYVEPVDGDVNTDDRTVPDRRTAADNGTAAAEPVGPADFRPERLFASSPPTWGGFSGPVFFWDELGTHRERMLFEPEPLQRRLQGRTLSDPVLADSGRGFYGVIWVVVYNGDVARTSKTEKMKLNVCY